MMPFTKILRKCFPPSHGERSPFNALRSTRRWAEQLRFHHEYEAHQMVVDALSQFNLSNAALDERRLRILDALRHAGVALQREMVMQYLKNQTAFRHAGKSLWQEVFAFYWQLALAYQSFVKAATRNRPALAKHLPTLTLYALHYQSKLIQWRYMRYESPAPDAWRNVHALYGIAEFNGFANQRLPMDGAETSCTHLYSHILLLNLINPLGLCGWKVELSAQWADEWCRQFQPAVQFDPKTHTHWHDLTGYETLIRIGEQPAQGETLRYWSMQGVLDALEITRRQLINPPASTLDGIKNEADAPRLLEDIRAALNRSGPQRHAPRQQQNTSVLLVCGLTHVLQALTETANRTPPPRETWVMQDESSDGYGLIHHTTPGYVPEHGTLIGLQMSARERVSTLAAIRWIEHAPGQAVKLGIERLGIAPRTVALHAVEHMMSESIFSMVNAPADSLPTPCIFLPAEDTRQVSSTLLVDNKDLAPAPMYDLLDGNYIYRIRITHEQDRSYDWVRLKFNILTRRHIKMVTGPLQ